MLVVTAVMHIAYTCSRALIQPTYRNEKATRARSRREIEPSQQNTFTALNLLAVCLDKLVRVGRILLNGRHQLLDLRTELRTALGNVDLCFNKVIL